MRVAVNGVEIPAETVAAEVQNHPAATGGEALAEARRALAIRELLLQRARAVGVEPRPERDGEGRPETPEEAMVRELIEREVGESAEPDEEGCRRYFEGNRERFLSPTLYEASHILFAAPPDDEAARGEALERAGRTLERLEARPDAFAELAGELSDCPSGREGGRLGQMGRGDAVPEIETFLDGLEPGQLCPVPVKSRYGVHVLRLDRRVEGRELPFEAVRGRIADYLEEAAWRRAVADYVRGLAAGAEIEGVDLAPDPK